MNKKGLFGKPKKEISFEKSSKQKNKGGYQMIGFLIALISGALMSIQGVFNTGVTKQSGVWVTNSFVQLTGFLVCMVIWFFTERKEHNLLKIIKVEPKYLLLGGVIGAMITWTVIMAMQKLGPAKAVLVIVIAQIFVAYLIELFGLFGAEKMPFYWTKLLGVLIAVSGIALFQWKS